MRGAKSRPVFWPTNGHLKSTENVKLNIILVFYFPPQKIKGNQFQKGDMTLLLKTWTATFRDTKKRVGCIFFGTIAVLKGEI